MDTADLDDQLRLVHLKFSGFDHIFIPDRLFYAPGEHDLKISQENDARKRGSRRTCGVNFTLNSVSNTRRQARAFLVFDLFENFTIP